MPCNRLDDPYLMEDSMFVPDHPLRECQSFFDAMELLVNFKLFQVEAMKRKAVVKIGKQDNHHAVCELIVPDTRLSHFPGWEPQYDKMELVLGDRKKGNYIEQSKDTLYVYPEGPER